MSMSIENIGNTIGKDFEDFLWERFTGAMSGHALLPDIFDKIDPAMEKLLTSAGVSQDVWKKLDVDGVDGLICDHVELVYRQGIKDGFHLALHLLGKAPDNEKAS